MSFIASSIALPKDMAGILAEVAWVNEQTVRLGSAWPRGMLFQPIPYASIYDCYPQLFGQAFLNVAEDQIRELAFATRLFATSIFLGDKLMDETDRPEARVTEGLTVFAFQHEAHRKLHRLFPHDCTFWNALNGYLKEYSEACLMEQGLAGGYIPPEAHTEAMALTIARGKSAISKAVIAGMCALSGNERLLEPLAASTDCYNTAVQMLDDLVDWRQDAERGMRSWVITRAYRATPSLTEGDLAERMERLGREIHYGGHTLHILQIAQDALAQAEAHIAEVDVPRWKDSIHRLQEHSSDLQRDIARIIERNQQRVAKQPPAPAVQIQPRNLQPAHASAAQSALSYLLNQWKMGFGEARHMQQFPTWLGFSSSDTTQFGDTFQRALIADTLVDVQERFGTALGPIIHYEADYLDGLRRQDRPGGWKYFPNLIELAPDADDLAQVMQVMARSGRQASIATACSAPLDTLFADCRHVDGSFETWIIPAKHRTKEQELQAEWALKAWGHGPDTDVMANLLYALHLAGLSKYRQHVQRGFDVIARRQNNDGSWHSTWYYGPYYGTYVCSRLLGAMKNGKHTPVLSRALSFLVDTQKADGSWGIDNAGDPLSTALALLALRSLRDALPEPEPALTQRGLDYLAQSIGADGSWQNVPFIRMNNVWSYGSCTMTTAFVIKALAHWADVPYLHDDTTG